MSDKYEGLRRAAEKATPGPWVLREYANAFGFGTALDAPDGEPVCGISEWKSADGRPEKSANRDYLIAASPDVILSLLQERDQLLAKESPEDAWRRAWEAAHHWHSAEDDRVPPYSAPKGEPE